MKLLLIDDDVFLRDMYAMKFRDSGFTVSVADSGATALATVEQEGDFDVILLDMVMPGLTGIDLMRQLQETFPNRKTKYIFLTNHGEETDIQSAKAAGAAGYIIKAEAIPSDVVAQVQKLIKS
ncbi:MAG: response regulator [Patescibacteria group bacterium]